MTPALLQLQQLSVDIETPRGRAAILHDIDLVLAQSERLGIVGESGSGKSMLALAIMGLLPEAAATQGAVHFSGEDLLEAGEDRMCALRGRRIAMIFQEPMNALNPTRTIGDQVAEGPRLHLGQSRRQAMDHAKTQLARVDLPPERFSPGLYPHQLSGGQRQRVLIAIALASDPSLLIADEPTTALDVTIQIGILDLIVGLTKERGMGLIMISHDLGVIARTTTRMAVMYAGRIVETGETASLLSSMAHPYSRGLLRAMPQHAARTKKTQQAAQAKTTQQAVRTEAMRPGASDLPARDRPRLPVIPGVVQDPFSPVSGCAFSKRCRHAEADCEATVPPLAEIGRLHHVACHHPQGLESPLESVR